MVSAVLMNNSCLTGKGRFITIWDLIHVQQEENDETNFPAQQKKTEQKPWLSGSHENKRRSARNQEQKTEGKKKTCRLMSETFTPQERIRKKKDFLFLYKKGNRYRGRYFNLIYLSNDLNFSRMAVVVSKKVGGAVERNTIKRRFRTLFRRNKHIFTNPQDIILIVKKEIQGVSWQSLKEEYLRSVTSIAPNH
jgi:ribonuclease P protein component